MSEEVLKKINIKKRKTARHIQFAVVANTGDLVSIASVPSGLACGCICAACGKQMEARKGNIRRHYLPMCQIMNACTGLKYPFTKRFTPSSKKRKNCF